MCLETSSSMHPWKQTTLVLQCPTPLLETFHSPTHLLGDQSESPLSSVPLAPGSNCTHFWLWAIALLALGTPFCPLSLEQQALLMCPFFPTVFAETDEIPTESAWQPLVHFSLWPPWPGQSRRLLWRSSHSRIAIAAEWPHPKDCLIVCHPNDHPIHSEYWAGIAPVT